MCNEDFYIHLSFQMAQTVNISNTNRRCSEFPMEHSGFGDMNSTAKVILRAPCPTDSTNPERLPGITSGLK